MTTAAAWCSGCYCCCSDCSPHRGRRGCSRHPGTWGSAFGTREFAAPPGYAPIFFTNPGSLLSVQLPPHLATSSARYLRTLLPPLLCPASDTFSRSEEHTSEL